MCVLQASVTEQTFSFWNRAPRMIFSISSFFFVPCFINLSAFVWGRMTLCYPLYLSVYQFLPFIWVFFLLLVDAIRVHSLCRLDAICYVMPSLMPFFPSLFPYCTKTRFQLLIYQICESWDWFECLIFMHSFERFKSIPRSFYIRLALSTIVFVMKMSTLIYVHLLGQLTLPKTSINIWNSLLL